MIIGNIRDFKNVKFNSKNLQKAFDYIYSHDLLALPEGKTVIDGDNVYVNRQSYIGKDKEACKIEGHHNYLDLQLVLKGCEGFGYVNIERNGLKEMAPYDPVKDKTNYTGDLDGIINLSDGDFALVYPADLHAPCMKVNDNTIEKAVFKIKID